MKEDTGYAALLPPPPPLHLLLLLLLPFLRPTLPARGGTSEYPSGHQFKIGSNCLANHLLLIFNRRVRGILKHLQTQTKDRKLKVRLKNVLAMNRKKIKNLKLRQHCTHKTVKSLKSEIESLKNETTRKNFIRWMLYAKKEKKEKKERKERKEWKPHFSKKFDINARNH